MKHFAEEVRFDEYIREINSSLKKLVDAIVTDIREKSKAYDGQVPENALTAYWECLSDMGVWEKVREEAIGIFMDRLSDGYPEGLKYLAKKVALSAVPQNGNGS